MQGFVIFVICLLQASLGVFAEGHYSVIGPGTVHSAHKYSVAVAVHDTTEPCQLKVGLIGPSYDETKLVELNSADEVKLVEFDVPELKEGDYNLTAEGVAGIVFEKNSTKLNYERFEPHVLIQTDKGVYKPGDEVQFRVIFLDENLRPTKIQKSALLWFEDSKRNRIKEFKDLEVIKGVYTGKFPLSEYAVLGNWRIIVKTDKSENHQQRFMVDKYVLPKYVVKLEATERVSVQDGDMQVVVRANYTYGKPVNGKAIIQLQIQPSYSFDKEEKVIEIPTIIRSADMVNGKAKFDLNVKEYETKINKKHPSYVNVIATVEEDFTGVKLNGTTGITFFPYRYQFMCRSYDTCSIFHPGKEAEVIIEVLHVDGSKVKDTKSVLRLTYKEVLRHNNWWRPDQMKKEKLKAASTEQLQSVTFESHLNDSSMAIFKVTLPELAEVKDYQHYFDAEIEYAEQKDMVLSAYQYVEPKKPEPTTTEEPKDYLKVNVELEKDKYSIEMGKESTVTVNSSIPLSYFVYTVVGRGNIKKFERIELPEPTKLHTFKFVPTYEMAPYARIYVHCVENGELRFAETGISIEWDFQNKIEIQAPEEVKVGEDVQLSIKTEPNSFVGLLGVDQSVLLLGRSNDVHEDRLKWRLGQYATYTPYQGGFSSYPGEISGVLTLTNAHYLYNRTSPYEPHSTTFESQNREGALYNKVGFSGASGVAPQAAAAADSAPAPAVRKDFPETWIFANIENTETENFTWIKKIPDTITSWVITGFSLNAEKGFASTKDKTAIKAFQPFFISIRLPYSVKRGEVISVPALVSNYLNKDLDVEVTLENTDNEFEFTEVSNEVIDVEKRSKTVRVPSNSAKGVSFLLRPKVIGNIMLKFTAISPLAGDALHKTLKVVPEGVTEYVNRAFFVNLKDSPEFKETYALDLPAEIVPDSEHAEFAVVGDLLGPLLNNLDSLVRMPTGCGEQTMSKLVPNYLMMRYLKSINKLTPELESRIRRNLESGYQNMLHYQHTDGSFSSFGPSIKDDEPRNGSTWLTAYVMRFLQKSEKFIKIDPKVITSGLKYLASKQAANGSFPEAGDYFYGVQRNEVSLTASVLLAFMEQQKPADTDYSSELEKGIKFVLEQLDKTEDLRAKAMAVYMLQQAKHAAVPEKLTALKTLAKTDADRMWWTSSETSDKNNYNDHHIRPFVCCWRWPRSEDVEITSYVLLSLLDQETETVESVLPVLKWLVAQRNSYGGFASTQDTVVGLQALIRFAEKLGYEAAEMAIDFKTQGDKLAKSDSLKVGEENALLMQSFELPEKTRSIDFHATGKGAALVQVSYQYNLFEKEKTPSFSLKTIINKETPLLKLEMEVCVDYVGENGESNMAVLEIAMPSGYSADAESFAELRKVDRVRQVESKNSDTTIVIYFESLRKNDVKCLPIEAFKTHAVAMQKPAPIVVYDYYDTSKKATEFYEVVSKLCDICDQEDEECREKCT